MPYPRVKFAVRYPAGNGKWRYVPADIPNYEGSGFQPLEYVPVAGDLVSLWSRGGSGETSGIFRVIRRMWMWSEYGSADWPYGKPEPGSGPLVDIIVERAEGAYQDETYICSEPTCEAAWVNGAWWMPPGAADPDPHEHAPYIRGQLWLRLRSRRRHPLTRRVTSGGAAVFWCLLSLPWLLPGSRTVSAGRH